MWPVILIISTLSMGARTQSIPGTTIHRQMSEGVNSIEYKVVYGNEDVTIMSDLIDDEENRIALKHRERAKYQIRPLEVKDLKCLVSLDELCSEEMAKMKHVIIQAIKEDCKNCSQEDKIKAGRIIAAMMAHDPSAWKLFLTRYAGDRIQRILG